MNQIIKDLVHRANICRLSADAAEADDTSIEKFVELIVKECENVVASQLEKDGDANDDWDSGYISGMWAATRYIREYFGVKE